MDTNMVWEKVWEPLVLLLLDTVCNKTDRLPLPSIKSVSRVLRETIAEHLCIFKHFKTRSLLRVPPIYIAMLEDIIVTCMAMAPHVDNIKKHTSAAPTHWPS